MRESILLMWLVLVCSFQVTNQQQTNLAPAPSQKTGRSTDKSPGGPNKIVFDGDNDDTAFDGFQSDEIINFPIDSGTSSTPSSQPIVVTDNKRYKKIPLKKLVEFGHETDISEFISKYVANAQVIQDENTNEGYLAYTNRTPIVNSRNEKIPIHLSSPRPLPTKPQATNVLSRSGVTPIQQLNAVQAVSRLDIHAMKQMPDVVEAVCSPQPTTVSIPLTVQPHILLWPRCVRVARCGGCCIADLLSCEPEKTVKTNFTVQKHAYTINQEKPLEYIGDETVEIERHLSCSCECKKKEEHCNKRIHEYNEKECSCNCKNMADADQCQNNPNKIWDAVNCMCLCRDMRTCSSGLYYDMNVCECQQDRIALNLRKNKRHILETRN